MKAEGFPEMLKALREKAGITQTELAKRLGVYQSMVARWELGKGEPILSIVKPLADALGVSVETLVSLPAPKPARKPKAKK
jgi:transcriptional regulator with XRE-family HTH domain